MITIERLARVAMEDMAIRDVIYYSDDLKSESWTEDGTWEEEEDFFLNREEMFSQGNCEDDYEDDFEEDYNGKESSEMPSGSRPNAGGFRIYGKYESGMYETSYETEEPGDDRESDAVEEFHANRESDAVEEFHANREPDAVEEFHANREPREAEESYYNREPYDNRESYETEESFESENSEISEEESASIEEDHKPGVEASSPLTSEDMEILKKERKELEALYTKFEDEKKQFRQEMKKLNQRASEERKRLKEEESFFDKKMNILKGGFAQLEADRTALEREKICWERERLDLEKRKDAALREDSMRIFFIGVNNPITLKKRYKDLIKIFHPDNVGGDTGILQKINKLYDSMWAEMGWQKKA